MKLITKAVFGIIFLGIISSAVYVQATETEKLIQAAIQEIKDLAMVYTDEHQVSYNPETKLVVVNFRTGSKFKYNYNQYYLLWWDMQFIALNAFEKRDLKVDTIGVFTNLEDNSGLMMMMTDAPYIRKYANAVHGMGRWLDLTDGFLWDEANENWRPVSK